MRVRVRTPEQRKRAAAWQAVYDKTPERVARRRVWNREYRASPEGKEALRVNQERHDAKPARKAAKARANARYVITPKGKLRTHRAQLRRRYGLSGTEYWAMVDAQGSACAICGGVNANGRRLYVDHDHATKAVRALLCHACNTVLGHARDNADVLRDAADYLDRHSVLTGLL